jgi:8-oxo-dGTP diphosphatase
MQPIRTAGRAIIIDRGRLLVTVNRDETGSFYLLPGGGQRPGETLPESLVRECREETGAGVAVEELLFVRDYIGAHHEFKNSEPEIHQIELMFRCRLLPGETAKNGTLPDSWQTGVAWISLQELPTARFYPAALVPHLLGLPDDTAAPVYLGDVN